MCLNTDQVCSILCVSVAVMVAKILLLKSDKMVGFTVVLIGNNL